MEVAASGAAGSYSRYGSAVHKQVRAIPWDDLPRGARSGQGQAYPLSKLLNILFTAELARRVAGTGVTDNCLHPGFVRTALFSRDGSKIVTAGVGNGAMGTFPFCPNVWDAKTGKLLLTLKHDEIKGAITSAVFSPDGLKVATVSDDKTVRLWSLADGQLQQILRGPIGEGAEGALYAVALSPSGKTIAVVAGSVAVIAMDFFVTQILVSLIY